MTETFDFAYNPWVYWVVSAFAIVAAYIDGKELRVPNKLTFPMIIAGWVFSSIYYGVTGQGAHWGLMWSLAGTAVGMLTLLPAYSIGGMGAGDVKMMGAIGAWVHSTITFNSFMVSAVIGAIIAIGMVIHAGQIRKHVDQMFMIANEIFLIRDPEKLAAIAADRKPQMRLLPYGIPLAIGTVGYFAWTGLLI